MGLAVPSAISYASRLSARHGAPAWPGCSTSPPQPPPQPVNRACCWACCLAQVKQWVDAAQSPGTLNRVLSLQLEAFWQQHGKAVMVMGALAVAYAIW